MPAALQLLEVMTTPETPVKSLSLYEHLELLDAADETAGTREGEAEFNALIREQILKHTADKVENVHRLIVHLKGELGMCDVEAKRIAARKKAINNAIERVRENVHYAMTSNEVQAVKGRTCKIIVCPSPDAVEITDEDLVPERYKCQTLTLSCDTWAAFLEELSLANPAFAEELAEDLKRADKRIDSEAVKQALASHADVPGADLKINRSHVQFR